MPIRREITHLAILTSICIILYITRVVLTGKITFLFLNWNLFLAAIPWLISLLIANTLRLFNKYLYRYGLLLCWVLFFPNAPYIFTDLYHIRYNQLMPIWYDIILILSYAWTGIMFGFLSLHHIEMILSRNLSVKIVNILKLFLFLIVGFGVYIGRFLRWNSWDLIGNPVMLLEDIWGRLSNPTVYPGVLGMTFIMGLFLFMLYQSFKFLRTSPRHSIAG